MCGRFAQISKLPVIKNKFDENQIFLNFSTDTENNYNENYNVAPKQDVAVILSEGNENKLELLNWGIETEILTTTKNNSCKINKNILKINTRSETLIRGNTISSTKNRCLIPVNGFYEWGKKSKIPYYIKHINEDFFFLAAIYEKNNNDPKLSKTFSIITMPSNSLLSPIHNRMPVVVPIDKSNLWLNYKNNNDNIITETFFKTPFQKNQIEFYEVSPFVNDIMNNNPLCIQKIDSNERLF